VCTFIYLFTYFLNFGLEGHLYIQKCINCVCNYGYKNRNENTVKLILLIVKLVEIFLISN
jgi:hypothetical protein